MATLRGEPGTLLVALLLSRRRLHAARDEVDHAVRAVVGLDLVVGVARDRLGADMALVANFIVARVDIRAARGSWAAILLALIAVNYVVPVGRIPFDSRVAESLFYGVLVFSPVFCAGLLFSVGHQAVIVARRAISARTCSARWSAAWAISVARHRIQRAARDHRALLRWRRDGPQARASRRPSFACEVIQAMRIQAFEPKFMKVGILTAALQELTPREVRDKDPDRAIEEWLAFARELGADCIQLSVGAPPDRDRRAAGSDARSGREHARPAQAVRQGSRASACRRR